MFELRKTVEAKKNNMTGIVTRNQKNVLEQISQVASVTEITTHLWPDLRVRPERRQIDANDISSHWPATAATKSLNPIVMCTTPHHKI